MPQRVFEREIPQGVVIDMGHLGPVIETKPRSFSVCIDSLFSQKRKIAWFALQSLVFDTFSLRIGGRSIYLEQETGMVKQVRTEDPAPTSPLDNLSVY